ncbi:copper resistance system multicopper oxidase [Xanthomonas hortorum pv. vitians]|uniref:copper resistance system multicopper oxidase n=1 Tax=Xanthomonas hortorum TaxID=56454 RepID=UPI0012A8CF06|nr:copper resistance system multicopper oxidase [Xanthomonas hortorum]MCE4280498.1 copper resistance system multicopper oxidase [Xanthomonas hortorum pv. vitians]MCE4284569.1 copper resistance system multicopper oxidase [Xanthomonas hortorum pv. vitians]MCE4292053.1 copper resistance system multicopper oxidase [Xanthomonas hortorum pv. vitians]MDT7853055.1 copper resistance system multicopper oxidase [Xanthomonas hortorum pv. vitians]NMI25065.1 copper resistance system multicopper oxidase [Xan
MGRSGDVMSFDPTSFDPPSNGGLSRRRFVQGIALGGVVASTGVWRSDARASNPVSTPVLRGSSQSLQIGRMPVNLTGRARTAITVNQSLPAPTLRWREGDTVSVRVRNALPDQPTSVHWHGLLLPANMDGVPGMSFDGIAPGQEYHYRFALRQSGTYWYHSHSMFQEQAGLYGAIVIDPLTPPPYRHDREHVVLLSDWTDLEQAALFRRLKQMPSHDNYAQRTVGDFLRDAREDGLRATLADRGMWGRMRMTPTDLSDVNANTYTYLLNGVAPAGNWTGVFTPGEKVLLRFINGSSMTYFDIRIPGLRMTVVAADGQYVHPVSVDELRIAAAETFDVIVEPIGQDAFTLFAQDMGRTGFACGTLAVRHGLQAPIPALDPRAILTIQDMGHGDGMAPADHAMHGGDAMQSDPHAAHAMAMPMPATHMHGHANQTAQNKVPHHPASEDGNPLIDMRSNATAPRLDDPGVGLRNNGRRVLCYADLHSVFDDPDGRKPGREIELHLTGHMEKFAWSFDGIAFASAEPLRLQYGERLRIVLVNDTMMQHPIHLHGMWSDLEDADGHFQVRKHTIDMPPGTRRTYRVRADALGRWAYHCHLLYHMEAGMMREVRVEA